MTDPTTTTTTEVALARALLALQGEVERLRELLDAKSHEAGLYARRMEQAQRSRDNARAEERAAVVAWLRVQARAQGASPDERTILTWASNHIDRGEHRREEKS